MKIRKSGGDKSCGLLIDTVAKQMTEDELDQEGSDVVKILANIFILFVAGFDTTSNLITMCLYFLACNPECQEKAYEEITKVLLGTECQ